MPHLIKRRQGKHETPNMVKDNSGIYSSINPGYIILIKIRAVACLNMKGTESLGRTSCSNREASSVILSNTLRTISPRYNPDISFSSSRRSRFIVFGMKSDVKFSQKTRKLELLGGEVQAGYWSTEALAASLGGAASQMRNNRCMRGNTY